tara:strand:+ start:100 stop:537 length:438 start_codon:yes stop_codon:yes gene_type:complete
MDSLDNLGELSKLISEWEEAQELLAEAESTLTSLKKRVEQYSEEFIPALMFDLGLDEIKTQNGDKVSVEKQYFAKIPEKLKNEAFNWLIQNGMGAVIKKRVVETEGVHHSTLKALVKERYENGEDIPEDLFGIYVKNVTKVTKNK